MRHAGDRVHVATHHGINLVLREISKVLGVVVANTHIVDQYTNVEVCKYTIAEQIVSRVVLTYQTTHTHE